MIINAKEELLEHIDNRAVEYVQVTYMGKRIIQGCLASVLPELDFDYDNGYGSQYLEGIIWYADGSWSEREEYDGREWWTLRVRPPLPRVSEWIDYPVTK